MTDLDQGQWAAGLTTDEAVIIDVRTPEEWEEGIIPGAKLLNIFNAHAFMAGILDMDKTKNYYIYCRSGGRSGQACQIMASQGFKNVFNLNGGFSSWKGATTNAPSP